MKMCNYNVGHALTGLSQQYSHLFSTLGLYRSASVRLWGLLLERGAGACPALARILVPLTGQLDILNYSKPAVTGWGYAA